MTTPLNPAQDERRASLRQLAEWLYSQADNLAFSPFGGDPLVGKHARRLRYWARQVRALTQEQEKP